MAPIQRLLEIMARLRDPEDGCPWDLEQDFASISPFTIEEAYEVDDAIRSGDLEALRDELGDLLFQVVFQARIAEERGAFDFESVIEAIASKLVRRHPHVFAEAAAPRTKGEQAATWESIKASERAAVAGTNSSGPPDPFEGIPRHLPALARSAKLAGRLAQLEQAASGSEESPEIEVRQAEWREALDDLRSRVAETASMLGATEASPERAVALSLVGEGLHSWVRVARALGVDPEQALREVDDARIEEARAPRA